jgi:hypothetical protein
MIVAVVEIPWGGPKRTREQVLEREVPITEIYHAVKGLDRKYILTGDEGGGGVYLFRTREDADAWFNDGWADWMEGRAGVRPRLRIFDCHLVLDNEADQLLADGEPIPAPWKADAAE